MLDDDDDDIFTSELDIFEFYIWTLEPPKYFTSYLLVEASLHGHKIFISHQIFNLQRTVYAHTPVFIIRLYIISANLNGKKYNIVDKNCIFKDAYSIWIMWR